MSTICVYRYPEDIFGADDESVKRADSFGLRSPPSRGERRNRPGGRLTFGGRFKAYTGGTGE